MADTKISALTAVSAVAGSNELAVNEAGTSKKASVTQVKTYLLSVGMTDVVALSSDAADNSTTTGVGITGLNKTLANGTYVFKYWIRYQSAASTTGVKFGVNFTGTATYCMAMMYHCAGGTTAITDIHDQQSPASPVLMAAYATRTETTTAPDLGPMAAVDTAASDMFLVIEGMVLVTASGDLELWHASEVAAASTVKAGTALVLTRVA